MIAVIRLPSGMRVFALTLGLAAAYAVLGWASLLAVRDTGLAAPVWPAAGLAVACVYQYGWKVAPGVALGSLLVNFSTVAQSDKSLTVALGVGLAIAVGAAAQALVAGALLRRYVGLRPPFVAPAEIITFLILAGPVASLINPTVGLAAQLAGDVIEPQQAAMSWLTWWVGDSIGVVVFMPLVLMLLPEQRESWRGRRIKVAVPSLIMLTVCWWFFLQNAQVEQQQAQSELRQTAAQAAGQLEAGIGRQTEALQGIGSFIAASDYVSRVEFDTYTRGILGRSGGISALSWNPVIPEADLRAFETKQRLEEGLDGFQVTERTADGTLVPVGPRDRYVVVSYIEPLAENRAALGFDILSNAARAEAILEAEDSGEVQATAPIDLVQETDGQKGVLLLQPVFSGGAPPSTPAARSQELMGFAVGVYRLQELLTTAFAGSEWAGLSFTLSDATADETVEVATIPMVGPPAPLDSETATITVGGRTWELTVAMSRTSPMWTVPTTTPAILIGGLVIIILLEAFLLLLTGNERQARREAEVHGYQANHDPLTDLYNRRAFLSLLEKSRQRAEEEASRHVLLFMDLDGFKGVNDTSGHEAGDDMLRGVARVLRLHMRERDVVARIGGDEFAAILNNCPEERGLRIAGTLVDSVEEFRLADRPDAPGVGLSVGLAMIDGADLVGIDELMRRADDACYRAKRSGGHALRAYVAETQT